MFKTFRVAGLAAAAAFLCSSPAAAQGKAGPALQASIATPSATIASTVPAPRAAPALISALPAPAADQGDAGAASIPGRARPDRFAPEASPFPAPAINAAPAVRRSLADLVAEHGRSETGDEQFECLARAVYFESRGEPLEGQLAVAEVILNRVRSGRFRSTICDVVKQPSQFSFVRRGVIPDVPRESAVWHRSVAIAHIAMQNLHDVTGDESLFFHATYVNPRWGRPRIARIGNHIFYR